MSINLPRGWTSETIQGLTDLVIGGDWGKLPSEVTGREFTNVLCIRGSEIKNWYREKGRSAIVRSVTHSSLANRALDVGDLIVEISGGGPEQPVGRVVYVDDDVLSNDANLPVVCTNFLRKLRLTPLINRKYVYYYLDLFYRSREVVQYQGGSNNLRNLRYKDYETIYVPLAPIAEQTRIVAKLDMLFEHWDKAKEGLERVPELMKNFRRQVLASATNGKLTEDWRGSSAESVGEYLDQLGIKYGAASSALPQTWQEASVEDYLFNEDAKRIPLSQRVRNTRRGAYPYYGATGIIDSIDGFTHDGEHVLISEDGKALVFRNRPISFIASGRFWVNNHAHVLRCKGEFPNAFVSYYFNVADISEFITGIDQVKLSQRNLNRIRLPIPPLLEQLEIVRRVEKLLSLADAIEVRFQSVLNRDSEFPQSLLAHAFKGELVPQDPKDEPAATLLARINKERGER